MFKFSNSDGTNLSKMDDLDIIKFLRLCRKEPVIWNKSHSHYNQGIHRLAASERISAALNLRNFAAMHVVGEFDRLRSVYGEELRKVLQVEDYETKVVWFDTMDSFMRPFVQQWNSEGSLCSGGVQEERANKMGIEYNDDVPCDVCRSPFCEEKNEMVFCDSCDICVHQACYGVTTIPEGNWYCRPCELNLKPSCVLCPNKGGAMKMTSNGFDWAHVSCAWWIKEVNIGCPEKMEPITNISSIPGSRWALMCSLCRVKFGACIQCAETHCTIAYHVTCAFEGGLRMEMEETDSSDDGVKLRSFCQTHRNNSMKSSRKSKKRKMESDSEDSDELKFSLRAPTQFQKKNGKNVKSRLRDIDNQETEDSLDFGEQNSEDDLPSLSGAGHQKTHSDKAHLTQPVTLHDIFGGPKSRGETSLRRFMYGLRPLPDISSGIKLSNGITEKESTKIPNSLLKSRHGRISKTKKARKKSSEKYSSKGRRRSTFNQSVGTQKGRSTSRDRKPPPKPKDDASSCCESPSTENRHQICCCNQTLLTQNVQWTSFDCQQFEAQDRYQECCCNHSLTIQNGLSVCCGGKPPTVQNTLKACCNQTHLNHTANQMSHCSQLLPTQIGHRESCCNRPLATQNGYWASFYHNPPKTQEVYQEFCGNQPPTIDIEHQLSCDYQSSVNPASYRNQPPETEIEHHTPCGNQPQRIKIEKQTSCDYQLLATPIKHPTSFRNQSPAIPIENQTSIKHQTSFGKQAPATKIGNESIFGDLPPAAELEHQTTSTQNEYRTSCASADTNVTKAQMAENGGVKRKETDTELESVHDPDDVFSLPSVEEMILNNSIPENTVEQNSEQSPKKYEGDTQFWKSVNCFLGSLPPENADKLKKEIISLCIKTRVQYISDAKVNRSESESD